MNKNLSLIALILFFLPCIILIVCLENHSNFRKENFFPFFDGSVSVSLVGRQVYNIFFFKISFIIYSFISVIFYYLLSNYFKKKKFKNSLSLIGLLMNIFLMIYIFFLGDNNYSFSPKLRRISIILYLFLVFISHIKILKFMHYYSKDSNLKIKTLSYNVNLYIVILMSVLLVTGLPWVNPFFDYPYNLKNIIEWNYLFLSQFFYIFISIYLFRK